MDITTNPRQSFWVRSRLVVLALSLSLFLPPIAFLPQLSGDTSFCGTWCPRMFWSFRNGQTWPEFSMGFFRAWLGVMLVAGILAVTLFVGRQWCSHLCPIGGAMELASRLLPRRWKIDYTIVPAAPVRYGYLAAYLLAPALGIGNLCCSYCNFATIPRLWGAPFSRADMAFFLRTAGLIDLGLVIVLGFFAKGGRAYCNLLCPIGALDALACCIGARFGKRVRVDAAQCTNCKACVPVCPAWAINIADQNVHIDQLSCFPCRECEEACTKGAIHFEWPRK